MQNSESGKEGEESTCGTSAPVPAGFGIHSRVSSRNSLTQITDERNAEEVEGEHREVASTNFGTTRSPWTQVKMPNAKALKSGLVANPSQDEKLAKSNVEYPAFLDTLLNTQLKCLKIQNALQQLLLLRLENAPPWWNSAVTGKGKAPLGNAGDLRKIVETPETVTASAAEVPKELNQPLRALLSCSGIQITLQQHISSLLTAPRAQDSRVGCTDGQNLSEKPGKLYYSI